MKKNNRLILLILLCLTFVSCGNIPYNNENLTPLPSETVQPIESDELLPDISFSPTDRIYFTNPELVRPISFGRRMELLKITDTINSMEIPRENLSLSAELSSSVGVSIRITNSEETNHISLGYLGNGTCTLSWIYTNHLSPSNQTAICQNITIENEELYRIIRTFVDDIHGNQANASQYVLDWSRDVLPDLPISEDDFIDILNPPLTHDCSPERKAEFVNIINKMNSIPIPSAESLGPQGDHNSFPTVCIRVENEYISYWIFLVASEDGSCWFYLSESMIAPDGTERRDYRCQNISIEDEQLKQMIRDFIDDVHANELND